MITKSISPFFNTFDNMFDFEKIQLSPKTNVEKNETNYQIKIAIPGLTKDDFKITIKESILKIVFDGVSLFVPKFNKTYSIPDDVDENNIDGKVEHGILTLTLPISKKKPSEKTISIS